MDALPHRCSFSTPTARKFLRLRFRLAGLCCVIATALTAMHSAAAATYQTRNFAVTANTPELAKEVAEAAEDYRRKLAVYWTGDSLPPWSRPCRVRVRDGSTLAASGQTTFQFSRGEVFNWDMIVCGSRERILDSVLPHEVNHTVFACYFRRPLPRWADEGAATLFEDRSEQVKQIGLLNQIIESSHERFSLRQLLSMKEYPSQHRPMLILYAQGFSLADFLVQQKGQQTYLKFLNDGEKFGWEKAIEMNFDHQGVDGLEENWQTWVIAGMPRMTNPRDSMLAETDAIINPTTDPILTAQARTRATASAGRLPVPPRTTIRSQSPDQPRRVPETSVAADSTTRIAARDRGEDSERFPGMPRRATIEAPPPHRPENPRTHVPAPPVITDAAGRAASQLPRSFPKDVALPRGHSVTTPAGELFFDSETNSPRAAVAEPSGTATGAGTASDDHFFPGIPRVPPGFEQTMYHKPSESGVERQAPGNSASSDSAEQTPPVRKTRQHSSDSNRDLLPDERNGKPSQRPQWAGFPGQQKLF
ncbi:MAG: hypothetical protein KDA96_03805 [Planctomycetaceae bacterium]|nr:hypothetical protein [Planctomycetaceae bacterium]